MLRLSYRKKMYSKHITEWRLFKNYETAEKEAIAEIFEANDLIIRDQQAKMHRLVRTRRQDSTGPEEIPRIPSHSEDWGSAATSGTASELQSSRTTSRVEHPSDWSLQRSVQRVALIEEQASSASEHHNRGMMRRDTLAENAWRIWTLAIWQIWFQGDFYHFGKLHRIAERPNEREAELAPLSRQIEPCLKSWIEVYRNDAPEVQAAYRLLLAQQVLNGPLTWQTYAGLGLDIALQKERRTFQEAKAIILSHGQSLSAAMMKDSAHMTQFRRGFEKVLHVSRAVLKHKICELKTYCEQLTERFHFLPPKPEEPVRASRSEQANVAVLSMFCHQRQGNLRIFTRNALHVAINQMTGFSTEKAFLWAARLMLYYASAELDKSPLPSNLCARALDGIDRILRIIYAHPSQNFQSGKSGIDERGVFTEFWQDSNFASIWIQWLCSDNDFFLHCYSK